MSRQQSSASALGEDTRLADRGSLRSQRLALHRIRPADDC